MEQLIKFESKAVRASRLRGLYSPEQVIENSNASFEGTHSQYEALRLAYNLLIEVVGEDITNERVVDNVDSMLEMLDQALVKEGKFIDDVYGDEEWNDY